MNKTNDPSLKSWIKVEEGSDFPIQNIPYGIVYRNRQSPHVATRIGNTVIDLYIPAKKGLLDSSGINPEIFNNDSLNSLISLGKPYWHSLREIIQDIFEENNSILKNDIALLNETFTPSGTAQMLLPVKIGDYTDFYSSIEHATNVGKMFRDPENALLPNWKHMPVAYHGRSSSIIVSGTEIYRPKGQIKSDNATFPEFGPTKQLDFELEMAFIAGKKTELGTSVSTADAEEHIFGMVIFNDLSARDIQKWEYVPLGPFLGKNFGSAISPWVVTMDALEPFRIAGPKQDSPVLPYLQFTGNHNFDIQLEVFIKPDLQKPVCVCKSNYKYIYWNMVQQLAHQTINGCNINIGDLFASGTISGPETGSYGSMLELAWKGTKPLKFPDESKRSFIHDNDTVIMKGYCIKEGLRIGFGEVSTKILPAK